MGTLRRDWLYLLVGGRSSVRKKFHKGSKLEIESRRMRMISPSIFYLKMFTCLFNGFSDPTFALTPSSWQLCDLYESIKTVSSLLKLFDGFPVKLKWNLNPFDSLQGPTWCNFCLFFFSLHSSPASHMPHPYISVTMVFFMFMYEFFLGITIIPKWIFSPSKCVLLKEDLTPWNEVKECFPASRLRDFALSVSSTWTTLTQISVKLCHSLH